MTLLLESSSSITVPLHMGPMVLFKVYSIALNMMKIWESCRRSLFAVIPNLLEKYTAYTEIISVTGHFSVYLQHELTTIATGGGCAIIIVV